MKQKWATHTLCACFVLGSALASAQQQPNEHEKHHPGGETAQQKASPAQGAPAGKGMMDGKCAMMQKDMERVHAEMSAGHAKLEGLVKEMNAASGSAKVDAVATVLTELVAHSEKMHSMHEETMGEMMQHMSEHMMQGMDKSGKSEMTMCPMMKEHGNTSSGHEGHADAGKQAPAPNAPEEKDSSHHAPQNNR